MPNKVTFTKQELFDLGLPHSSLENEIDEVTRWSVHHTIVFTKDNKFYQAHYSEGATEMQCESPWEYEDNIECIEVKQKEKIVKVWVPV